MCIYNIMKFIHRKSDFFKKINCLYKWSDTLLSTCIEKYHNLSFKNSGHTSTLFPTLLNKMF